MPDLSEDQRANILQQFHSATQESDDDALAAHEAFLVGPEAFIDYFYTKYNKIVDAMKAEVNARTTQRTSNTEKSPV